MVRQNIVLHSSNKSLADQLGNDIDLRFPNTLFYKAPFSLELLYLNIEYDITTFGNTNNGFFIEFTNNLGQSFNKEVIVDFYAVPLLSETLTTTVHDTMYGVLSPYYTVNFDIINRNAVNIITTEYESTIFVNTYLNNKVKSLITEIYSTIEDEFEDYKIYFKVTTSDIVDLTITDLFNVPVTNYYVYNQIYNKFKLPLITLFYYRVAVDVNIATNTLENILIGHFNTGEVMQNDISKYPIEAPKTIILENIILAELNTILTNLTTTFSTITKKYTLAFDITFGDIVNIRFINYTNVVTYDIELREMLDISFNSQIFPYYDLSFDIVNTNIENIITNYEVEQDLSTTLLTITINGDCTLNFNIKESIGPILGLGNGTYENKKLISGTSTQSIESYNLINVFNSSGNKLYAYSIDPLTDLTNLYPEYNDINCKMELYDSNNNLIPNLDSGDKDVTISINRTAGNLFYTNIGFIIDIIQDEMNRYASYFTPSANFLLTFDPTEKKVNIINTTGAKFGIGFDFYKYSGGIVSGGSLHKVLGFNQKQYLSITSIISVKPIRAFQDLFAEDYLLFCSDIANGNTDINVIGIGNNNNVKSNNIMYAIPISQAETFQPVDSTYYSINIKASNLATGYANKTYSDENPITVNFYLRLLSGRHLKSNMSWSAILALNYSET
jgi:hypothetical protein